jgi:hypothetical protein
MLNAVCRRVCIDVDGGEADFHPERPRLVTWKSVCPAVSGAAKACARRVPLGRRCVLMAAAKFRRSSSLTQPLMR